MQNILIVTSSALGAASASTRLAEDYAARVQAENPHARIVRRDVGGGDVPHLTAASVGGVRGEPASPTEQGARDLSDTLIAELRAADLVVIASPMYNFGISSTLKAWFDHVLRAGETFRYTAEGPQGLLGGRQAIVIETRGGRYSAGPAAVMDSQEPHLRTMLGFVGITDVTFVRAEALAAGGDPREASAQLAELARFEPALAA